VSEHEETMELEEIAEIVCLQLGVERAGPADRLLDVLGADSADLLNIIVAVEDRYGIAISEEDVAGVGTVEDLYRLASRLVAP
jgi:acyl carrier protein